jgi:hypothetical protein
MLHPLPTCCRPWGPRGCTVWVLGCGSLQRGCSSCRREGAGGEDQVSSFRVCAARWLLPSRPSRSRVGISDSCCVPNSTSFALCGSPSGPEMVVRVCPHRGPGAFSRIGNVLGRGTPVGRCPKAPVAASASICWPPNILLQTRARSYWLGARIIVLLGTET